MQDEVYVLMEALVDFGTDSWIFGIYETYAGALADKEIMEANELDCVYWVESYGLIKG